MYAAQNWTKAQTMKIAKFHRQTIPSLKYKKYKYEKTSTITKI